MYECVLKMIFDFRLQYKGHGNNTLVEVKTDGGRNSSAINDVDMEVVSSEDEIEHIPNPNHELSLQERLSNLAGVQLPTPIPGLSPPHDPKAGVQLPIPGLSPPTIPGLSPPHDPHDHQTPPSLTPPPPQHQHQQPPQKEHLQPPPHGKNFFIKVKFHGTQYKVCKIIFQPACPF